MQRAAIHGATVCTRGHEDRLASPIERQRLRDGDAADNVEIAAGVHEGGVNTRSRRGSQGSRIADGQLAGVDRGQSGVTRIRAGDQQRAEAGLGDAAIGDHRSDGRRTQAKRGERARGSAEVQVAGELRRPGRGAGHQDVAIEGQRARTRAHGFGAGALVVDENEAANGVIEAVQIKVRSCDAGITRQRDHASVGDLVVGKLPRGQHHAGDEDRVQRKIAGDGIAASRTQAKQRAARVIGRTRVSIRARERDIARSILNQVTPRRRLADSTGNGQIRTRALVALVTRIADDLHRPDLHKIDAVQRHCAVLVESLAAGLAGQVQIRPGTKGQRAGVGGRGPGNVDSRCRRGGQRNVVVDRRPRSEQDAGVAGHRSADAADIDQRIGRVRAAVIRRDPDAADALADFHNNRMESRRELNRASACGDALGEVIEHHRLAVHIKKAAIIASRVESVVATGGDVQNARPEDAEVGGSADAACGNETGGKSSDHVGRSDRRVNARGIGNADSPRAGSTEIVAPNHAIGDVVGKADARPESSTAVVVAPLESRGAARRGQLRRDAERASAEHHRSRPQAVLSRALDRPHLHTRGGGDRPGVGGVVAREQEARNRRGGGRSPSHRHVSCT